MQFRAIISFQPVIAVSRTSMKNMITGLMRLTVLYPRTCKALFLGTVQAAKELVRHLMVTGLMAMA